MRRLIDFGCDGETLIGTLDAGTGACGLLIVSGGNEIRSGAHRGMALLAQRLAGDGFPVFRFDRRGIGDSTGTNRGYASSAPDIASAVKTFVAEAGVTRLVAFGNCDAATALALFHDGAGLDALVLANPWVVDPHDDLPPAAAVRAHYAQRLSDPATWRRVFSGGVSFSKFLRGLRKLATKSREDTCLADQMAAALSATGIPTTIVLAERDATARAFVDAWPRNHFAPIHRIPSDSHSFAPPEDMAALEAILRAVLAGDYGLSG